MTPLHGAATGVTYLFSGVPGAEAAGRSRKRVYVLVVDGCQPGEIGTTLTPNLAALRNGGRNFPHARSLPMMGTIPNHVMMMTGVRPDRSGVPANEIYDRALGAVRTLDRSTDLGFPTVLQRLRDKELTTGTVLSKEYLYGVFGTRPTYRWEPKPIVPVSGHAPDVFTMDAALAMVEEVDPNLVFVNLGDCDRVGHSDLTDTRLRAARTAALVTTDTQVGRLGGAGAGHHSMDWSRPDSLVSFKPSIDRRPAPRRSGANRRQRRRRPPVLDWCREPSYGGRRADAHDRQRDPGGALRARPPDPAARKRAGDVMVDCEAGYRFSDPNQLPNHVR